MFEKDSIKLIAMYGGILIVLVFFFGAVVSTSGDNDKGILSECQAMIHNATVECTDVQTERRAQVYESCLQGFAGGGKSRCASHAQELVPCAVISSEEAFDTEPIEN